MNKKILFSFLLSVMVLGMAVAPMALAAEEIPDTCTIQNIDKVAADFPDCAGGEECTFTEERPCGLCCLVGGIYFVADWVFAFLILLVIIFVLWGAFEILTSAGNEDKFASGRTRIMFAAIGFAAALLAKAIPGLIQWLL